MFKYLIERGRGETQLCQLSEQNYTKYHQYTFNDNPSIFGWQLFQLSSSYFKHRMFLPLESFRSRYQLKIFLKSRTCSYWLWAFLKTKLTNTTQCGIIKHNNDPRRLQSNQVNKHSWLLTNAKPDSHCLLESVTL